MKLLRALAAVAAYLTLASAVQATVIDFESIPDSGSAYASYPASPFLEDGYELAADIGFASWDSDNPGNFTGSKALLNDYQLGVTTLTKSGGGSFSLNSIDLSELGSGYGSAVPVTFTGIKTDASVLNVTFNLDGVFGNETFGFVGWSDLASVSWVQEVDYHQFDNIVVDAVPEPGTMLLLGSGLLGLAARRRRSA